jgi:hypothetical protein
MPYCNTRLDPGKWEAHRKIRSTYSDVVHASCQRRKVSLIAYQTRRLTVPGMGTTGSSGLYWDVTSAWETWLVVSDYAVYIRIFKEILDGLERDHAEATMNVMHDNLTGGH